MNCTIWERSHCWAGLGKHHIPIVSRPQKVSWLMCNQQFGICSVTVHDIWSRDMSPLLVVHKEVWNRLKFRRLYYCIERNIDIISFPSPAISSFLNYLSTRQHRLAQRSILYTCLWFLFTARCSLPLLSTSAFLQVPDLAVAIPLSDKIIIDVVRICLTLHFDNHPSTSTISQRN